MGLNLDQGVGGQEDLGDREDPVEDAEDSVCHLNVTEK